MGNTLILKNNRFYLLIKMSLLCIT